MIIIGAGIAGLLAATAFPQASVWEARERRDSDHKALLRFRTTRVADLTGIEFRKVRVHKGIWYDREFKAPDIQMANMYSNKVLGRLADRSIWNIEPVDRYVAPEDFVDRLQDNVGDRVRYDAAVVGAMLREIGKTDPLISTMPMPALAALLDVGGPPMPRFEHRSIKVQRFRIHGADVFQTIYFPSPFTPVYRASITGDLLIIEATEELSHSDLMDVENAFDLKEAEHLEDREQRYGKIAPIDDVWRKNFIHEVTLRHNIYSLGRFGTWRNVLLDDIVNDISVIKRLIGSSRYEQSLQAQK
jgi:hypothetical protein